MIELCGWSGAILLLVAYGLLSKGRIANGRTFQALNFLGALGVGIEAFSRTAYAAGTLNVAWMLIAAVSFVNVSAGDRNSQHPDQPS